MSGIQKPVYLQSVDEVVVRYSSSLGGLSSQEARKRLSDQGPNALVGLKATGAEAIVIPCDLTKPEQCEQAAEMARKTYGRIDILVNVAGGSGPVGKTGAETTPEEFDEFAEEAREIGYSGVLSGPLVRSSYRAGSPNSRNSGRLDFKYLPFGVVATNRPPGASILARPRIISTG